MRRERYSRGRFVARGRILIPTTPLTPSRPRSATPSSKTRIPLLAVRHRLPVEIQQDDELSEKSRLH